MPLSRVLSFMQTSPRSNTIPLFITETYNKRRYSDSKKILLDIWNEIICNIYFKPICHTKPISTVPLASLVMCPLSFLPYQEPRMLVLGKVPCNTKNDKNKPRHTPTSQHLATIHPLCALYKPGVSHALQSANHPHTA